VGRIALATVVALVVVLSAPAFGADPQRTGTAGVTVALPAGWHFFRQGVAPRSKPYADPLIRIVAASAPVVSYPRGCKAETFRFSRPAVGLMIVEWVHPQRGVRLRKRPSVFTARNLPIHPGAVECWPGPGGAVEFTAHGRSFAAYVLLSEHAPHGLAAEARDILDTLAVSKRS
jgi:hypothetical protein